MTTPRVGFGFDAHRLGAASPDSPGVLLGGVSATADRSVIATSDGDVVAHALCDALLGAAGLGDIGEMFPSADPQWEGADSMSFLATVVDRVSDAGHDISSVDVTVIAQSIRVAPIRFEIRAKLAVTLGIAPTAVSVKATTTDEMGYLGRDEGIAATAVAVLASGSSAA